MKKALLVASVASMIDQFNMANIEILQSMGCEVSLACNFSEGNTTSNDRILKFKSEMERMSVTCYQIDFSRNIRSFRQNIKAFSELKKVISDREFDLIHCQSPIGGLLTRMAAGKARPKGTKVIYTAHGFHFYKGAGVFKWLAYYPIEHLMSRYTDVLITINREDFSLAYDKFTTASVMYLPGVGIDLDKFSGDEARRTDRTSLRKELSIKEEDKVVLSVGELNANKNHEAVIRALKGTDYVYVLVGKGKLRNHLMTLATELGVKCIMPGYRDDILRFYNAADAFAFPSVREGLPVSLMEAMAAGLPCVVSNIRGNVDLVDKEGGFLVDPSDEEAVKSAIDSCLGPNGIGMGEYNRKRIKNFSSETVNKEMTDIYSSVLVD